MMNAVLYLRSSKDRSDVSIDAQRRKLQRLIDDRGIRIVGEYVDVVESAKSEDRPGLQELMRDMTIPGRAWSAIVTLNTSRLSRRQWFAFAFRKDCERFNVQLIFAEVPEMDPVSNLIMHSVLTAMDEIHSLRSKEHGLAGMRENVRKGWRAGGRAPRGYKLQHVETDTVRDGKPVLKSRLVPTPDLPLIGRYLTARAQGRPRKAVHRALGIPWAITSLIGIEWNALTYAGHTVWNRHAPNGSGKKYRPRSDWVVEHDTHEAVITTDIAEKILRDRESSTYSKGTSAGRAGASRYLLTGLLVSPDGKPWVGCEGKYYRFRHPGRSRRVHRDELDTAILSQLEASMTDAAFLDAVAAEARKAATPDIDLKRLRREIVRVNTQVDRAMSLALELDDPAPAVRKVDDLERERNDLARQMRDIETQAEERAVLATVTADDIRRLLAAIDDPGAMLAAVVERITLDPDSLECQIHYRVEVPNRARLASPRGFEPLLPP